MTRFDNLTFPDSLEEIGQGAFQNTALCHVTLPETCLTIGPMAFQLCWAIEEIKLPENLESIPQGLFSMCDGLEKLKINNKCKHIEDDAFMWCVKLSDISFNQALESIGNYAFDGCALTVINLPPTLQQLGALCFGAMSSTLHEVRCAARIPPICEEDTLNPGCGPFSPPNENEEFTLYVPYGTKTAYSTTWGWDCFFKIEESDDFPWSCIENISSDKIINKTFYDLQGNKVQKLMHNHIYICNGKKFLYQGNDN